MPRLGDLNVNLEKNKLPTGNYAFSATRIADLGASEYTLVTIVVDVSGSTITFRDEMEKCLKQVLRSCKYGSGASNNSQNARSDNLMIRLVIFATQIEEIHGFKLLANCNEADYDGILSKSHHIGATTALYDATVNGIEAECVYGRDLIKQDFSANGIIVVITDGLNNEGVFTANTVKQKLIQGVTNETLESMVSILIGVNITDQAVSAALQQFQVEGGLSQYVDVGKADEKTLAKLANFISKSISSQSQSLGTGGPSKALTF